MPSEKYGGNFLIFLANKFIYRDRDMAQFVIELVCIHEDLSLDHDICFHFGEHFLFQHS